MSAGIASPYANRPRKGSQVEIDGIFVCADTKMVASDNATSRGTKMSVSVTPAPVDRTFVVASSADDAHAAKMLSNEIISALCDPKAELEKTIKQTMQTWYSAYGGGQVPTIEFIIGASVNGHCSLFYCSPPNTLLQKFHPFVIGTGARAIEPLLPYDTDPLWKLEPTILRAAYWMHRAKEEEGVFVGGNTDAAVISKEGGFTFLECDEMEQAEQLSPEIEKLFDVLCLGLFSRETLQQRRSFLSGFSQLFRELSSKAADIRLDSLKVMDKLQKARQAKGQKK